MKVTIEDLSRRLAKRSDISEKEAEGCIRSLFEIMADELARGNDIVMKKTFNLEVYQHKRKVVRNINTNEPIEYTFKKVRFKPCLSLREKINQS